MPKKTEEDDNRILIRSSSLGSLSCCPRHFAASREREYIGLAHPDVLEKERSGGYRPYIGTAFHKCLEDNVKSVAKIKEITHGIIEDPSSDTDFFDEKFQKIEQLEDIVQAMVSTFRKSEHSSEWTMKRHGNKYEVALTSKDIDSGILLSGHIDCIRKDGLALDLKTGVTNDMSLYQEQLTAYRMLIEHSGRKTPPFAEVVKVSRPSTPKFRTPPSSKRYRIDVRPHESRVVQLVKRAADIVSNREKWIEDFTRLPANPSSKACSYCELKNTSACPETQREEI